LEREDVVGGVASGVILVVAPAAILR